MRKLRLLTLLTFSFSVAMAQNNKPTDTLPRRDTVMEELKDQVLDNLPTISLDDNDLADGSSQNVSSVLTAGRDPFFSAASFNWSSMRFKVRGYDNELNNLYMNGIPMENLDNGFAPWGLWGGLNDVMRNRDLTIGLRPSTFGYGDIGSSTNIDSRASKQRKQTSIGYALSNRNYTHRVNFTHSTGMSKKGWAFTISGSRRWASEGYIPGTYYDSWSYFAAIDKKLGKKHMLSLTVFGAPTENGRQTAAVKEANDLVGSNYYNPAWGYQNGKKRNANVAKTNQPFGILTHDFRMNNNTTWTTAFGFSKGERTTTALDWYNSADPRPDYYRYLPSYEQDPIQREKIIQAIQADPNLLQINWASLYEANRNNRDNVVDGVVQPGTRSHYIIQDRVNNTTRVAFNTVINTRVNNNIDFSAGATYQWQKNNYFNRVNDLLGGSFWLNVNQFAERDFPSNQQVNQWDLDNPNRIVKKGDKYGHNYDINIRRMSAWAQGVFRYTYFDFFLSGELSSTSFHRYGYNRNGLFPNNSQGKSATQDFVNYAVKGGVTYKIDGRNYVYVNGTYLTRAPFFDNVYLAPRTRDFVQQNVQSESIGSVEGGYVLNAPRIRMRISGYYTNFDNQMNVNTFYHDEVQNFVNYGISNIDKVHYGGEFGIEAKVMPNVTANAAVALGRYYYNSRQNAVVTVDNASRELDINQSRQTIYSENYRVGSTPQEAYSLGVTYRSPNYWFVSLTGNYFDQMWLEFNPIRRTQAAIEGLNLSKPEDATLFRQIVGQTQWNSQFTLDFFGGYSYKLPNKKFRMGSNAFLVFNLGINNILNNKDLITGGFEQLRFDFETRNVNKFPPKLYYAYGLNYFASVTLRF